MKLQVEGVHVNGSTHAVATVYAMDEASVEMLTKFAGKEIAFPNPETTAEAQAKEAQRRYEAERRGARR